MTFSVTRKRKHAEDRERVEGAAGWLVMATGLVFLKALFTFLGSRSPEAVQMGVDGTMRLVAGINALGFGLLAASLLRVGRSPAGACTMAFVVYGGVLLASGIIAPALIVRGLVWKALIVLSLARAAKSARDLERERRGY